LSFTQSQSFTGFSEQEFNHEDWNVKASFISEMEDDLTPPDARQEAGDDAYRAHAAGDDSHNADVWAELLEGGIPDVVGEEARNAEKEFVVDQQVHHISHFFYLKSFYFLSRIHLFFLIAYNVSLQDFVSIASDITTQSGILVDCFDPEAWSGISEVIRGLNDPTQRQLHAQVLEGE
jgi:hypothetical protein